MLVLYPFGGSLHALEAHRGASACRQSFLQYLSTKLRPFWLPGRRSEGGSRRYLCRIAFASERLILRSCFSLSPSCTSIDFPDEMIFACFFQSLRSFSHSTSTECVPCSFWALDNKRGRDRPLCACLSAEIASGNLFDRSELHTKCYHAQLPYSPYQWVTVMAAWIVYPPTAAGSGTNTQDCVSNNSLVILTNRAEIEWIRCHPPLWGKRGPYLLRICSVSMTACAITHGIHLFVLLDCVVYRILVYRRGRMDEDEMGQTETEIGTGLPRRCGGIAEKRDGKERARSTLVIPRLQDTLRVCFAWALGFACSLWVI
ncbi:hypothetical protein J3F83DRAFT_161577 [Trichoderma novae-zelandiae]